MHVFIFKNTIIFQEILIIVYVFVLQSGILNEWKNEQKKPEGLARAGNFFLKYFSKIDLVLFLPLRHIQNEFYIGHIAYHQ